MRKSNTQPCVILLCKMFMLLSLSLSISANSQEINQNWVKQINYKVSVSAPISNPSALQAQENLTYLDGLGRPVVHIANQQSDLGNDIVTPVIYDDFGRKLKEYLPYVSQTQTMDFVSPAQAVSNVAGYSEYAGQIPYSEQLTDNSPLNRPLKIAAPGTLSNWAMGSGNEIRFEYKANATADNVRKFEVSGTQVIENGPYGPNTLFKIITRDENNHLTIEFKNSKGQLLLKRTNDGTQDLNTYYVYDASQNLIAVIPPLAEQLALINTNILDKLCYQYRYDYKNRLMEKKLPQKQWEYIVYDGLGRIAATGPVHSPYGSNDSEQGWIESRYDIHNRVAYTFWTPETFTAASRQNLQNTYNGTGVINAARTGSGTIDGVPVFYTSDSLPANMILLTVNYYDSYDFPRAGEAFGISPQIPFYDNSNKPTGLPTGSWTRILDTNAIISGITSVLLYDYQGRVIFMWKSNMFGGNTNVDKTYNFGGQLLNVVTSHKRADQDDRIITADNYSYTDVGRASIHTHQINPGGSNQLEFLAQNHYTNLGRLTVKECGGETAAHSLQHIDYSYNIRGWLTGINDTGNLSKTGLPQDLFAFKINYDIVEGFNNPSLPQYNGNISETYWRTSSDDIVRKYGYVYDGANRMTDANYQKWVSVPSNSYREQVAYDANGNITGLLRNGNMDVSTTTNTLDDLTYFYDTADGLPSNRLLGVIDDTHSPLGFKDDAGYSADDYVYDADGNLYSDQNKRIAETYYNHLNLPVKIVFYNTGKQIDYIYDAAGTKLQKRFTQTPIADSDYIDGYQYYDGVLKFFPTSEGYVSNTVVEGDNVYKYVYNYTDHLGNIRLSYGLDENGVTKALEENHYYPFGLRHTNYNTDLKEYGLKEEEPGVVLKPPVDDDGVLMAPIYKYKFNAQELQDELGLNVYDMAARNYMPDIGRWGVIDELAEDFVDASPYSFANNNPIFFSDPSGLSAEASQSITSTVVNRKGEIIDHKDDGDDSIYLESRKGKVIGKEQEDKEYKVGEYLEHDDIFSNAKLPDGFLVKFKIQPHLLEVSPLLGGLARGGANGVKYILYLARGGKGLKGIEYIGITSQFAIRQATHLRQKGILIEKVLEGLSKADAKAIEQVLIEMYKLGGKAGQSGQLLNKINSIAKTNPAYGQSLKRGAELLKETGLGL